MKLDQNDKNWIRSQALNLGFMAVGFSKAQQLEKEAAYLEAWLSKGHHGQMGYMENHFDLRTDPTKLVPGAKSVISFLYNYFPEKELESPDGFKVSKYAYGRDYHKVVKKKLKLLGQLLEERYGQFTFRNFVDSGPVLEKAWAERSGLGWTGKNVNLISKQKGSFFFVSEMISDLPFDDDGPTTDHCGSCTKCMDACPTDALIAPYQIDGSKCISYYTIELKQALEKDEYAAPWKEWVYGCDICQDVCPWNKFSSAHNEPDFKPKPGLIQWLEAGTPALEAETFNKLFDGSAMRRAKADGLNRNVSHLKG